MSARLVSVIIPSFNRHALTARAVKSVLAQTHAHLEVIVVDDASREEEIFDCNAFQDDRVRLVRHQTNRGLAAARNTGVEAARGEVVAGLDCDDYWFPEKLASQMAIYERLPDPEKCLIYSAYYWEERGMWKPHPFDFLREGEPMSEYLFIRQGDVHGSNWLGHREVFRQFPSAPEMKRHQDWDMLLRMEQGGVRFISCPTLSGVRSADMRSDRLSTAPVREMRELFVQRNRDRITARALTVWEALEVGVNRNGSPYTQTRLSFLNRQLDQLRYILETPRLPVTGRFRLVYDYVSNRLKSAIHYRLKRRLAPAANAPE